MGTVLRLPVIEDGLPSRPQTRGECVDVPRPCPFVSCRFNLFLSVDKERRGRTRDVRLQKDRIVFETTHECPSEVAPDQSCVLDVADRGALLLEQIGEVLSGVSRERIRQIEASALAKLRESDMLSDVHADGFDHELDDDELEDAEGDGAKGAFVGFKEPEDADVRRRETARRAYERSLVARGLATWRTQKDHDDGTTRSERAGEAARTSNVWTKRDQEDLDTWLDGRALDADDNPIAWPARIVAAWNHVANETSEVDTPTFGPTEHAYAQGTGAPAPSPPAEAPTEPASAMSVTRQRKLEGASVSTDAISKSHVSRIGRPEDRQALDAAPRSEGQHAQSAVAAQECTMGDAQRGNAPDERNVLPDAAVLPPATLDSLREELEAIDERRPTVVAAIAALEALQEGVGA